MGNIACLKGSSTLKSRRLNESQDKKSVPIKSNYDSLSKSNHTTNQKVNANSNKSSKARSMKFNKNIIATNTKKKQSDSSTDVNLLSRFYKLIPDTVLNGVSFSKSIIDIITQKEPNSIVVASIGQQSLGKSYFLNTHFGTEFKKKEAGDIKKCTIDAEAFQLKNIYLMDYEGIDSNDNSTIREHYNLTLSLAFSDIILMHIMYKNLNEAYIERFAFSYWLAIKSLNKKKQKLPKFVLLLRESSFQNGINDQEINKRLKEYVGNFIGNVNERLNYFNSSIEELIRKDDQITDKDSFIEYNIPNLSDYAFKVFDYYPVYYDTMNFRYVLRKDSKYDTLNPYDVSYFVNYFNEIVKKVEDEMPSINEVEETKELENIEEIGNEVCNYLLNLEDCKKNIKQFFNGGSDKFRFYYDFCLEIELDNNYCCKTIGELITYIQETSKAILLIIEKEVKELEKVNKNLEEISKNITLNHFETIQASLSGIQDNFSKSKILNSLIKDAASNYNKYLGFNVSFNMNKKGWDDYSSLDQIFNENSDYLNYDNENYVVFLLEIILTYNGDDYENLIKNELIKINNVKKFFESLTYYDKVQEFYVENIERFKFRDFFMVIFLILKKRIMKMFKAERLWEENYVSREETQRKRMMINWRLLKSKIMNLIDVLGLNILSDFEQFFLEVQGYFDIYVNLLGAKAEKGYLKTHSFLYLLWCQELLHILQQVWGHTYLWLIKFKFFCMKFCICKIKIFFFI